MKLKLTLNEARLQIADQHNLSPEAVDIELPPVPPTPPSPADHKELAKTLVRTFHSPYHPELNRLESKKIVLIKLLRELVPGLGLAVAKQAIEAWM